MVGRLQASRVIRPSIAPAFMKQEIDGCSFKVQGDTECIERAALRQFLHRATRAMSFRKHQMNLLFPLARAILKRSSSVSIPLTLSTSFERCFFAFVKWTLHILVDTSMFKLQKKLGMIKYALPQLLTNF